jgi:hypothetical protein
MAMSSGIYGQTLLSALENTYALDLSSGADSIKWQFVNDTETPNFNDTTPIEADIANEVTGTGYTSGGEVLAGSAATLVTQYVKFDGTDVSLATTTLSNVEGVIGFDDTIASPVDPLLWATDFGQSYTTTAGTFAITWNANGIFRFSLY